MSLKTAHWQKLRSVLYTMGAACAGAGGSVLLAATEPPTDAAQCDAEAWSEAQRAESAEDWDNRLDGLDRGDCYTYGYHDGVLRKHREGRR